ncbi:hypothetical protein Fmac_001533 [Flemingia macrophylla]|uniref:Uncharacterized protein n=1 Tax=Flemingia macrophylla TaxID=520843 RepID=A0ABD1NHD7_9FABA
MATENDPSKDGIKLLSIKNTTHNKRGDEKKEEEEGGAKMAREGLQSLFPIEDISVMGLWELLSHLYRIRRKLVDCRVRASSSSFVVFLIIVFVFFVDVPIRPVVTNSSSSLTYFVKPRNSMLLAFAFVRLEMNLTSLNFLIFIVKTTFVSVFIVQASEMVTAQHLRSGLSGNNTPNSPGCPSLPRSKCSDTKLLKSTSKVTHVAHIWILEDDLVDGGLVYCQKSFNCAGHVT